MEYFTNTRHNMDIEEIKNTDNLEDHDGQFTSTVTQRARWIKYEEDLEAEVGRWGKPHVASLTFHSLINLRLCMESGTLLLDISARDLPELLHRVVECCQQMFLR